MKIKGINKAYFVEVKLLGGISNAEENIAITCGDITGNRTSVMITPAQWEKLIKFKLK